MLSKGRAHALARTKMRSRTTARVRNELIVGLRVTFYETIQVDCASWTICVRLTMLKRIRRASTMRGGKGRRISPRYRRERKKGKKEGM